MNDYEKGSALPRGLSSLTKPYLAPVPGDPERFTLSLWQAGSAKARHFHLSREELEDWRQGECAEITEGLADQIAHLTHFQARYSDPDRSPEIMGILNVTPDSFSDGGQHNDLTRARDHAAAMVADGASVLDIGGESTRPGAAAVPLDEELARVIPVIEACKDLSAAISVDTRKKAVMAAAVDAGAGIVNDVSALEYDPESLAFAANSDVRICLMHSAADPAVMQNNPEYAHVLFEVIDYLANRIRICEAAGIPRRRLMVDPGIGFGKTMAHNLTLLKGLPYFHALGCDLLLGVSRKAFVGRITGVGTAAERLQGSVAAALYGAQAGASVLRVHDVRETREALQMWQSIARATF